MSNEQREALILWFEIFGVLAASIAGVLVIAFICIGGFLFVLNHFGSNGALAFIGLLGLGGITTVAWCFIRSYE